MVALAEKAAAATKHRGRDTAATGRPFANVGHDIINSVVRGTPPGTRDNVVHVMADGSGGVEKEASGEGNGRLQQFEGRAGLKVRRLVGVDDNGHGVQDERQDDEARLMASIARLDVLLQNGTRDPSHHNNDQNQNGRRGSRSNKGSSPKMMTRKNHAREFLRGNDAAAKTNGKPIIPTTAAVSGRGTGPTR